MQTFVSSLGFGIIVAGVLLVSTIGFTLQYAISGVFNLAYGAIMAVAMLIAYVLNADGLNIWWCVLIVTLLGSALSWALERGVIRPMLARRATVWVMMIVTFAVGIIIEMIILGSWGPQYDSYKLSGADHRLGDLYFTTDQLWIVIVALLTALAVSALLRFTQLGRAVRGTAANPVLARSCGIRTARMLSFTWLISGALCGAGGALLAIDLGSFTYDTWETFMPLIIAAAILGGIGSPIGAMTGAVIIGVVSSVASGYLSPAYQDVIALGLLIVAMLVRPSGLLAPRTT